MQYGLENKGVRVVRDTFGEHFSSEIKCNYMLDYYDTVIIESEEPKVMVKEIDYLIDNLKKWKTHFERFKKWVNF